MLDERGSHHVYEELRDLMEAQRVEEGHGTTAVAALMDLVRSIVPDNVVAAAVNMNVLGVISFSLFFGACLSSMGEAAAPLIIFVQVCIHRLCTSTMSESAHRRMHMGLSAWEVAPESFGVVPMASRDSVSVAC